MSIVVIGAVFVDVKGFPYDTYLPTGRNSGYVQYVHGGVARNVVEDIANLELRPTFISLVDNSALGEDVVRKLKKHKVNTEYMKSIEQGMGTWLAVFEKDGNLAGSISQRPDLHPIYDILEEKGDEIFSECSSVIVEVDIDDDIVSKALALAKKYNKPIYAVISNMSIAVERRDLIRQFDCLICNELEAGIFFSENYENKTPEELVEILSEKVQSSKMKAMVVTMGGQGSVYAGLDGTKGITPPLPVNVKDTTGAGDAYCAGLSVGLTYGKSLEESTQIGTRLAASVLTSSENVCPRFIPEEFNLEIK